MTVAVVACASPKHGRLPPSPAGVSIVDDLCTDPRSLVEPAAGATGLVLVAHPPYVELPRLQAAVRRAGFDPLGVPLLDIGGAAGNAERLRTMIAAGVARTEAFSGSRPEQARPVMPAAMSRRALLTVPRPFYEAVPSVDHRSCAAADGCSACVEVCPVDAYRFAGGRIAYDKKSCVTCGLCVTTCPVGAIEHPAAQPGSLRAEIDAIVASASPVGIAFTCAASTVPVTSPNWYGVTVPCSGMVPGTWIVAALLLGAAAATLRPCRDAGCPVGHDDRAAAAVRFGRDLVMAAGISADAVPDDLGPVPVESPAYLPPLEEPFGVHGPAEVTLALEAISPGVAVGGAAAPLGVIDIDERTCTMCTMCAETCPTGALSHGMEDGVMKLSFDAGLCTGCSQCLPMCPERERGAISLRHRADGTALAAGRVVVRETETVSCQSCGRPIAPAATLDRIAGLLGESHAATATYLATRCMDCRGLS